MRHAFMLPLLVMALAAGCRSGSQIDPAAAAESDVPPAFVQLEVQNHNWADVVIYVEHGGTRTRVGLAKAASETTLRIPSAWTGFGQSAHLIAHRVGSRTEFRSESFLALPDQDISWTLESDLEHASLTIR